MLRKTSGKEIVFLDHQGAGGSTEMGVSSGVGENFDRPAGQRVVIEEIDQQARFAVDDDLAYRRDVGGYDRGLHRHRLEQRPAQYEGHR